MADLTPMTPERRRAYALLNACAAPVWLAMIVAPDARATSWLADRLGVWFVALGVGYDAFLVAGMAQNRSLIDYGDGDAVRRALTQPDFFLAGWAHYIAFDLFVGRWIWEDSRARGRRAQLALLLTWLAGPAGLSLYLVQRAR